MAQFEMVDCLLIPLTPIHIGGGDEAKLGLEHYRVNHDTLERINLRLLLLREGMGGMTLQGAFQQQSFDRLRDKARADDIEERIHLAPASAAELSRSSAVRQGRVDGFQRAGGQPVLPGSSLKGALRTAWLAHCSGQVTSARLHDDLVKEAFGLASKNDTDTDPFRDVTVEDVVVPLGGTQIDRIYSWKKDGRGGWARKDTGQMHWELLRSVANGGQPPLLDVRIGVRTADIRQRRGAIDKAKTPSRSPDSVAALFATINAQHEPIWRQDLEKFFSGHDQRLRSALQTLQYLFTAGTPTAALIRIGRGGHAESKSVTRFRRIEIRNPKTKEKRTADYGTTRHIVSIGAAPVSLGWAVLVRKDCWKAPETWLPEPATVVVSPSITDTDTPITQRNILYRKGQRVLLTDGEEATMEEDMTPGMKDVRVEIYGDTEVVGTHEIKGTVK